jgi:hypothetical protein
MGNIPWTLIFVVGIPLLLCFIFYKNKIVFELDERYFNLIDLRNAAVDYLKKQGRSCEILEYNILLIDKKKYYLSDRTIPMGFPVQQVVLRKMK